MPFFEEIRIQNFRNLGSVSIEPSPHLNVLVGPNGAGKTSFLECLCVFAHGRSFRTNKYKHLVKKDEESYIIRSTLKETKGEESFPLGIQRFANGKLQIRFNNENVSTASSLAKRIPIVVITGESFKLLEAGPKERRKFFDWLVFHVKPEFANNWQQVVRCYKQRNTLLRRGKISYDSLKHWDREIAKYSHVINSSRSEVFDLFISAFRSLACSHEEYSFLNESGFELKSGWKQIDKEEYIDIERQLEESFERDLRLGYSTLGPHKAELAITNVDHEQPAKEVLSRGQQKTLICTMYYALAKVYKEVKKEDPMVLVDDLPAELDIKNQRYLGSWLESINSQIFVSGISKEFVEELWGGNELLQKKVFHVEHGTLRE